jgi:hypothetical protein
MAFGQIRQIVSAGPDNASRVAAFAAPVLAGNTIMFCFRAGSGYTGTFPLSISDSINPASYTVVESTKNPGVSFHNTAMYILPDTLAGTPAISFSDNSAVAGSAVSFIVEIEGKLSVSGVSGFGYTNPVSQAFGTTAGEIPANSTSFAFIALGGATTTKVLTAPGWAIASIGAASIRPELWRRADATAINGSFSGTTDAPDFAAVWASFTEAAAGPAGPDYTQRKSSSFDVTHTLGTITTATLNAGAITINSTGAGTVNLTDTSGITTSGVYNLVLGDGAATETYTVQVNVFGVVPSNNPAQKNGAALASLTNVQVRITSGTGLNGVQRFYSPTEATDASGNFSTLDLSSSVAAAADPVLMHVLTAAGDSIISSETVGLI